MVCKPLSIRYIAVPESPCSAAGFRLPRDHQNWPRAHLMFKMTLNQKRAAGLYVIIMRFLRDRPAQVAQQNAISLKPD
jgi:hypothetical protein